jgi:hypothetical protein
MIHARRPLQAAAKLYRPMMIKAPAAIAKIAMTVPSPEKLRFSRGIRPVAISQIPNNSIPRFLVTFIVKLLVKDKRF